MDKIEFSKQLELFHGSKKAITRCSSRKPGKYVVNTLLNAIKDSVQALELLTIPDALQEERSKSLATIKDAQAQISLEYSASPSNRSMIETITPEMDTQVDRIRDELSRFDTQGLKWIG